MTIVGVIRNERVQRDLRAPMDEIAYVPIAQAPRMQVKLSVHTRRRSDSGGLPAIREAVRQIDPLLALADIRTLEDIWEQKPVGTDGARLADRHLRRRRRAARRARALRRRRRTPSAQQRREIGIRMALGARSNDVLSMVVRHVVLTDLASDWRSAWRGALLLTRVTESLLFEVSALDPVAFAIAAVAMAAIGLVAAAVPAQPRDARRPHHRPASGLTCRRLKTTRTAPGVIFSRA